MNEISLLFCYRLPWYLIVVGSVNVDLFFKHETYLKQKICSQFVKTGYSKARKIQQLLFL